MKKLYRNSNKRVIGKLINDGKTFRKTVHKSKHLFRAENAWALDANVLDTLEDSIRIEIFDVEEKVLYVTTAKEFREKAFFTEFPGFGRQGFLPLQNFTVESPTASVLASPTWVG